MTRTRKFLTTLMAGSFLLAGTLALSDDGEMVFKLKACDTCHSVPDEGIKAKIPSLAGPDLVNLDKKFDAEKLAGYIRQQIKVDGEQHPREFKGHDEELRVLVAWLLPAAKSPAGKTPAP